MDVLTDADTGQRADLLNALRSSRRFLRFTTNGLTDEQATARTTVSELTIAGIIKHVAFTERRWLAFAQRGALAMQSPADPAAAFGAHQATFRVEPGETLAALVAEYDAVAAETEAVLARVDLDQAQELPPAPWFEPGACWTVRMVLLHVLAETAQHAGHADIIREAIDGQKTMG